MIKSLGGIISKITNISEGESNKKFDNIIIEIWRPIFGCFISLSWMFMISTICYVVIYDAKNASDIIETFSETASLWGGAFGVLGLLIIKNVRVKKKKSSIKKVKKRAQE